MFLNFSSCQLCTTTSSFFTYIIPSISPTFFKSYNWQNISSYLVLCSSITMQYNPVKNKNGMLLHNILDYEVAVTLGATTCCMLWINLRTMLILLLSYVSYIYMGQPYFYNFFEGNIMADTDRRQLVQPTSQVIFEEEFTDSVFLGCFSHKVYVVIKQRTLYIYNSKSDYEGCPGFPKLFFNLNHATCTLEQDHIEISNRFVKVQLAHDDETEIANLNEAIKKGRVSMGPQDLYPNKFVNINSQNYDSIELA